VAYRTGSVCLYTTSAERRLAVGDLVPTGELEPPPSYLRYPNSN